MVVTSKNSAGAKLAGAEEGGLDGGGGGGGGGEGGGVAGETSHRLVGGGVSVG